MSRKQRAQRDRLIRPRCKKETRKTNKGETKANTFDLKNQLFSLFVSSSSFLLHSSSPFFSSCRLRENQVFSVARDGSVAAMKDLLGDPKKPKLDVLARGAFGETILHVACLFANFPVAKYLVANYPPLIDAYYEKELYQGENALHIAIVQADIDMVEFLLKNGAEVNNCKCVGTFFKPPTGKIYIGEHPLTFAACVEREGKNREMVRLLLKYGASFFNQDDFGNTLLHVLVIHGKADMYGYIMDLYGLYKKPGDPDLEQVKNKQGRTPLCLAAALARGEIFELIMKRKKETLWIYGPMAANAYPLDELDTFHPESKYSTALELVVYLSGEWGNTEEVRATGIHSGVFGPSIHRFFSSLMFSLERNAQG